MRRMTDRECRVCHHLVLDRLEPTDAPDPPCPNGCGPLTRILLGGLPGAQARANAVKQDSIPGGLMMEHGICHEDGTPKRYDSHSDIRRALDANGMTFVGDDISKVAAPVDVKLFDPSDRARRRQEFVEWMRATGSPDFQEADIDRIKVESRVAVAETLPCEIKMDDVDFEIRRACSIAELNGVSEDRPGSEQQFLDNVATR